MDGMDWVVMYGYNNPPSQNIPYFGNAVSSMGINNTFTSSDMGGSVLRGMTNDYKISDTSCNYSASIGVQTCNLSVAPDPKPADFNLGTGWGQKQTQAVTTVSFEVGNLLTTDLIYYASREELVKMGIDMGTNVKVRSTLPSAFGEHKYCPVPKGWQG